MTIIRDGTTQKAAEVTSDCKLSVRAVQLSVERNINEQTGRVWSVPFKAIDPANANDYFLYIKNSGSDVIEITDFRLQSTVVGTVEVQVVSGTASGGSDITLVGRNLGLQLTPENTTIQSGVDITGLTNDGIIFFIPIGSVETLVPLKTSAGIIISPGKAIALLWDKASGVLSGTVSLHER